MSLLRQIKTMTGQGFTIEIREAMHGGFDMVVRNKDGRHLWCNVSAKMIDENDENSLLHALEECEREADAPPG